jgi:hypothetical protein
MKFFSSKKNPADKLRKQYEKLQGEAMMAQRGGDIVKCSELTAQAEEVLKQIDAMENA